MQRWGGTVLLISLVAAGCGSARTGRATVDSTLAALMPPDATMLVGVRMETLDTTPLYQKLLASQSLRQLDDFARETGFDPRRDVREMLIGSNGKDVVLAARGTFRETNFEGLTKQTYKGYTLSVRGQGGVALIDGSTAVAGTLAAVEAVLDRHKSGDRTGPDDLLTRARQIPAQNQIWSVSNGFDNLLTMRVPETGNLANAGRILRSLENTTVVADFRAGVNGSLTGLCRTEQDAKNLGDAARGLIGLGRLSVPEKQPELLRLWDGIQVDQQQRTVTITVAVPEDLVEKLLDLFGTRTGSPRLPVKPRRPSRSPASPSSDPESHRPV
jgi:hypothetical protein